jgi:hypothetical protein
VLARAATHLPSGASTRLCDICDARMGGRPEYTVDDSMKSAADKCLFIKRVDGVVVVVVLVYVDDMAVAGPKLADVAEFKKDFGNKFDITDIGELKYILAGSSEFGKSGSPAVSDRVRISPRQPNKDD